jgi:hypothetical protein
MTFSGSSGLMSTVKARHDRSIEGRERRASTPARAEFVEFEQAAMRAPPQGARARHGQVRASSALDKQDGGAVLSARRLLLYNDRCTVALVVRRTDLEKGLKALGWAPTSKASGRNHRVWTHPQREFELYIPQYDLIPDAVGQRILDDAGE